MYERYVNKAYIIFKILGGKINDTVNVHDIEPLGLPKGITVKEVCYVNETTIAVRLNCRIDIKEKVDNIQFILLASALKDKDSVGVTQLGKLVIYPDENNLENMN